MKKTERGPTMLTGRHLAAACASLLTAAFWIACAGDELVRTPAYEPPECKIDEDCDIFSGDRRCGAWDCSKGKCSWILYLEAISQYQGDCHIVRCSRSDPQMRVEEDLSDAWDDGNPCTEDLCDNGTSYNEPRAAGLSPLGHGFCDGQGHQVGCLADGDCRLLSLYCSPRGRCIPRVCDNGVLDPDYRETGVDCGGACDPCAATLPCNSAEDCLSNVCHPDGTCAPPSCDDRVKNGEETDIDCEGDCALCATGASCSQPRDCESQVCWGGRCQRHSCRDGTRNGQEEGVDCGGSCPRCPDR